MALQTLKDALDATQLPFAHFAWAKGAKELLGDHGVYAEDGANDLYGDDKHAEKAVEGTVDYYTRDGSGTPQATIETALNNGQIAWYLNSVDFEPETGYVHYEWVFQV